MFLRMPHGPPTLVHEPVWRIPSPFAAKDFLTAGQGTLIYGRQKSGALQLTSNTPTRFRKHLRNLMNRMPSLEEFDSFSQFPAFLGDGNFKDYVRFEF